MKHLAWILLLAVASYPAARFRGSCAITSHRSAMLAVAMLREWPTVTRCILIRGTKRLTTGIGHAWYGSHKKESEKIYEH
jgi:hypothetical protein